MLKDYFEIQQWRMYQTSGDLWPRLLGRSRMYRMPGKRTLGNMVRVYDHAQLWIVERSSSCSTLQHDLDKKVLGVLYDLIWGVG